MKLKVGALDVVVSFKDMGDEVFGHYDPAPEPHIDIHKDLTTYLQAMTVLHEVLECIVDNYGLSVSESGIRVLENLLVMIVKDNPEEVQRWLEDIQGVSNDNSRKSCKAYRETGETSRGL
tara:strand:- start:16543 stop:16902 length:360 start_codon:yes stop_codon:yes gene_type:complete